MLGRKKERREGEGRKNKRFLFSLPAPYPAPFDSPRFLPSFRVSTCAFGSKTFARPKKTLALQARIHPSLKLREVSSLNKCSKTCVMLTWTTQERRKIHFK